MTDDQFWRIVIGGAVIASIPYLKPKIMPWLQRLGYRDWKEVQREKREAYLAKKATPEQRQEPPRQ